MKQTTKFIISGIAIIFGLFLIINSINEKEDNMVTEEEWIEEMEISGILYY